MQSRRLSMIEAVFSTLVGFVISTGVVLLVFPLFGWQAGTSQAIQVTLIFTGTSVLRVYLLRRFFNWIERKLE